MFNYCELILLLSCEARDVWNQCHPDAAVQEELNWSWVRQLLLGLSWPQALSPYPRELTDEKSPHFGKSAWTAHLDSGH